MGRIFHFAQRAVFCVIALLMVAGPLYAQDALAIPASSAPHFGIPEDWSSQHVIYTRNGSAEDMLKVRDDPRFLNSILLHNMRERGNRTQPPASTSLSEKRTDAQDLQPQVPGNLREFRPFSRPRNRRSKVDWAVSLGPTSGMAIGESPAKYTFDPTGVPSCSDFVVFTIDADAKAGTQANLVALTDLYSGTNPTGICGTAPTFLFSYAIGSGYSVLSPVLSLDGTKVAWFENRAVKVGHITTNHAYLHVTKWVAGQGTDATTGSVTIGASSDVALDYTNASGGCPASVASFNSTSDMYIDYSSGNGFVSADNGILYHIKGVFSVAPTVDFCITVNPSSDYMSGTVYDSLLNEVFVSDSTTLYAYTVGATSFTLAESYLYAGGGFASSPPVLDPFNEYIYVSSTADINGNTSVAQLPTSLASAVFVTLGPISFDNPYLFHGAFDYTYIEYGPTNAAATMYSCGTDSTNPDVQDLFAIGFLSSGLANPTPVMSANTNVNPGDNTGTCSPITEFYDGSKDRIFVGMGDPNGTDGANLVTMWDVTTQLTDPSTIPTAQASPYLGGTSGFSIDNNAVGVAQAESVYFSTIQTSPTATTCGDAGTELYCAVKLTQSGLK
jgi:hypothetical protein